MNQQMYHPKMLDMKTAIAYMLEQLDIQRYHDEVEYICISNLIYQSGERLLPHHKKEEMAMFVHYMNDLFPNWEKNPYYLKRSKFCLLYTSDIIFENPFYIKHREFVLCMVDLFIVVVSFFLAYWSKIDFDFDSVGQIDIMKVLMALFVILIVYAISFFAFKIHKSLWKYISLIEMCIRDRIMTDVLKEGDALPSMRTLAKELRISVITTKRAYEELEKEGFIETITGKDVYKRQSYDCSSICE